MDGGDLVLKIVIFSDNVAPYRIAWAEEIGKLHDVAFAYVKEKDLERNDSWLVKTSERVKMIKLPAKIVHNKALSLSVLKYMYTHKSEIVIFDGYGTIPNVFGMLYMNIQHKYFFVNADGVTLDASDNSVKRFVKKIIFGKYSYFLCGSEFTRQWLQNYGISKDRSIAHNFSSLHENDIIDHVPTNCERSQMRITLGLENRITVIAVGRFLKLKQFDMLIKAFIPFDSEYQLVIIGEGDEKATYDKLIRKNRLKHTKIINFMSFEKLKKYYIASDILVLPSYSEVWGLVVNEGMGCGALPAIVSNRCIVGYSLVRNTGAGFQFDYNNMIQLREKLDYLLKNEEIRIAMSKKALENIRKFTIEKMARRDMEGIGQQMDDKYE